MLPDNDDAFLYASNLYRKDPYRSRKSKQQDDRPPSAISSYHPAAVHDAGRANSYLPYTNHAPDLTHARNELYVEDDSATLAATSLYRIEVIGNDRKDSLIGDSKAFLKHPPSNISLAEELYKKRQTKLMKRRTFLVSFLLLLAALVAIAYFCWPRIPNMDITSEKAEALFDTPNWGPDQHPWLHATWLVNLTIDNRQNWIRTYITGMEVEMADSITQKVFGWATIDSLQLPARAIISEHLQFKVDYESDSVTDPTFENIYNACGPQVVSAPPALNITVHASFRLFGIVWVPRALISPINGGLICPSR
ncbi:uncharacterized protein BYT42DRAFT_210635 [Radiomyces spectabilis]|uniref:uncharacterized protein n=1 Tax=Radiomyces spectabilis TaxID=64574 RepID=UPI0022200ED8|nr:uncharacterized protein BYT42DRAFT_210635 [Radiomyces spectabilis]KAI8391841.1 hypothetical protein BYT42DRAFT_210635 [Radiomyces spectabilis]